MPLVAYNLDESINSFFAGAGAASSREECDEFARQIHGGAIRAVEVQGSFSYTVTAGPNGNKIMQFREQTALLDMKIMALAKEVHGDVVPNCCHLGWVGNAQGSQLAVYEMDRLLGDPYITFQPSLTTHEIRLNTVLSLASFFAHSWRSSLKTGPVNMSAVRTECRDRFSYLADTLPERFLPAVTDAQAVLPTLLDGCYPVVLTHSDLNEMNILVNPNSGEIIGIVDWSDTSMLPFGMALYALETALGRMFSGWKWLEDANELREAFWDNLTEQTGLSGPQRDLAKQAAKAGILFRYGPSYNSGVRVRRDDMDFRYLDSLILGEAHSQSPSH